MAPPDEEEAQYANYPAEKVIESTTAPVWTPLPLRPFIYIPYILFLILLAVALEVAFHFSQKNSGYPVLGDPAAFAKRSGVWHYVYTLPLVALAMFVVGVWAWTDIEIKKLQPYVDLVQGDSPPHRSLLLDYTRHHNFFVWTQALRNKHYTVFLASILAIATLAFQPLASALLDVRDIWWSLPQQSSSLTSTPNLTGSPSASSFLSASGFASAQVKYPDLPNPPFVKSEGWTLSELAIPPGLPPNGTTITYNTTAIKTLTNCRSIPVNMQQQSTAGNWINTINDQATSCGLTFNVSRTGPDLFGASVALCSNSSVSNPTPQTTAGKTETNPAVFWFFTYQPTPSASATICTPQIQLFDVTATLTLPALELANVVSRGPGSNTGNITNGLHAPSSPNSFSALNGLDLPTEVTSVDSAIRDRLAGVRVTLSAAIFQSATKDGSDVQSAFASDRFVAISDTVYTTYLSLLARTLYFSPPADSAATLPLTIKTTVKRLFISAFSAHFLTVLLLLLALLSLFIHASHTYARRNLHLRHLPGTIASAVSIGGQTGTSALLGEGDGGKGGGMTDRELKELLREKKFRIDPRTMKIVMEGEEGYGSLGVNGGGSPNSSPTRGEFLWVADLGDRIRRRSAQLVGGSEERRKSRRLSSLPTATAGGVGMGQRSPGFREHIVEVEELDEAQTPKTSTPGHKERDPLLNV